MHIDILGINEMTAEIDGQKLNFEAQPMPVGDESENPFALENNKWRMPAAKKENEDALRSRLRNHCRFWEVYFTWALNTKRETIDVRSTPSPIKIYGNGFTLKTLEDEPDRWKSYFYDEEDCRKGNEILKSILDRHEIALAHTDNKYKMFIGAFQQLENTLK
jgi:hypothetical protein